MIGGNMYAIIQSKTSSKNVFGELITTWNNLTTLQGFLDYTGGNGSYKNNFKGDVEETTHIFICDYTELNIEPTKCRAIINNKTYDILMIDNPMELNEHLEIFLKYNEVIK